MDRHNVTRTKEKRSTLKAKSCPGPQVNLKCAAIMCMCKTFRRKDLKAPIRIIQFMIRAAAATSLHGDLHEPARVVRRVDVSQVSSQVGVPQKVLQPLALT